MIWNLLRSTDLLGRPVLRSSVEAYTEPPTKPPKFNRRYPLTLWTDGRQHTIRRGKDFDRPVGDMQHHLYELAMRRDLHVRTSVDGDRLTFEFYPRAVDGTPTPNRPRRRYPIDAWLDGRLHTITRGVDFDCSPANLRRYLYRVSGKRVGHLVTRVDGDSITFRFTKESP